MAYPRAILNRLRWTEGDDIKEARITYLHRGAPGDRRVIGGEKIVEMERSFFVTWDAKIPYHRIRCIEYRGRVLFDSERTKEENGEE